ncbi:response regulator [Vineibacter terrae]|uniref:Regulatory protein VirG n=1 Tax=Vineibacter terrae TaxID=2586908 RepID=A0A5C8PT15_9HYPH|nr:response regulator [Vineibacter terrae]TXL80424.1 response regulator [Vineibacter terrae]
MLDKPTTAADGLEPAAPRVLVVDDDPPTRQLVVRYLTGNGIQSRGARDAREMREALAETEFDLIVLDIMLPGVSGLDLCREIRQRSTIPIIMLTAKGDETDRIVGLEIGADDYLSKPFSPRELLARTKAVLRRRDGTRPQAGIFTSRLGFSGWTLDLTRRELLSPSGAVVDLTSGEHDLLVAFVEHPQRVLSRDRLLDLARNRVAAGFDRSVDVQVSRLRRKIEGEGGQPMIKTVRGVGYMFVSAVHKL